jgi:hypothetical protein
VIPNSTSGIYLWCNTIAFQSPSVSAYFCNYISTYAILSAETQFSGQTNHAFTPTIAQFAYSTPSPSPTPSVNGNGTSSASTSSQTATATKAPAEPKKPVDKKVIIGGAVGGIGGLALVVGAVLLFIRWRNTPYREEEGDGNTTTPPIEKVAVQAQPKK